MKERAAWLMQELSTHNWQEQLQGQVIVSSTNPESSHCFQYDSWVKLKLPVIVTVVIHANILFSCIELRGCVNFSVSLQTVSLSFHLFPSISPHQCTFWNLDRFEPHINDRFEPGNVVLLLSPLGTCVAVLVTDQFWRGTRRSPK